jgi:hypothetical protein
MDEGGVDRGGKLVPVRAWLTLIAQARSDAL